MQVTDSALQTTGGSLAYVVLRVTRDGWHAAKPVLRGAKDGAQKTRCAIHLTRDGKSPLQGDFLH